MQLFDLDINLFNSLRYSLLMQVEVVASQVFDSHMYADSKRVITLGVGFNVEELDKIKYICALKLEALKPILEIEESNSEFINHLNDTNKLQAIETISQAISSCIQSMKNQTTRGIKANDKQNPNINNHSISIQDLENNISKISNNTKGKDRNLQENKATINATLQHNRALLLELSVNKTIEETIKTLNNNQYKNNKLSNFSFTLNKDEAEVIFSIISTSFYKKLINILRVGHSKAIFSSDSFALHSKLILSFLSNYYQMPKKFTSYYDPQEYFSNAISKNNSRFLTWFGLRYYIDLVSATSGKQSSKYIRRRVYEAALFELVERDVNGNIDMFTSSLEIFKYLNQKMLIIHTNNQPLKNYDKNYSYLEFIKQHPHCQDVDKKSQNSQVITLSTLKGYKSLLDNTTKINDISNMVKNSSMINSNNYIQGVLDFADYNNIFIPFLLYINEKFSKGIIDIDYKLEDIFVVNHFNISNIRTSLANKLSEKSEDNKRIEILIISLMENNLHQRFYDILLDYDNVNIAYYVLKNSQHILTVENLTAYNFRILFYDKLEINAVKLYGEYIFDKEDGNYFYKHSENNKLFAEYILTENKLIITYDNTTSITLLNYIPTYNHCGIILSNQEELKPENKVVSQSGKMQITIDLISDNSFDIKLIDKVKYYLYNVVTEEIIDTIIETDGNKATANFKINMADSISNIKCIFSFNYKTLSNKHVANTKFHNTCLINHLDRKQSQYKKSFNINIADIPLGLVTGIELIKPTQENIPDRDNFMETEYKFKAITKDVKDNNIIKWSYAVLTDKEYQDKQNISTKFSYKGLELTFKPKDILSSIQKKQLENKDSKYKLCVFAYVKKPAYYTNNGQTHALVLNKPVFQNIKPVIILDAGHGIIEYKNGTKQYKGAIYPKNLDYGDNNLLIIEDIVAFKFVQILHNQLTTNFNIELTRNSEKYVYNKARVRYVSDISKKYPKSNIIFVSIHLNSSDAIELPDSSSGIEFLYSASNEKLKTENLKIIDSIRSSLDDSSHQYFFRKYWKHVNENVTVLGDNIVPAVLLELGFINNKRDRENLLNNQYLTLLAEDIAKGIKKYFEVQS